MLPLSLREADRLLALFGGHLFPDHFSVLAEGPVFWVQAESEREVAIRGRQVAGDAVARGVEGAHRDHRFGIGLIGSRLYVMQAAFTILGHATTSVEVLFAEHDVVGRFGSRLRRGFRLGLGRNCLGRFGRRGSLSSRCFGFFVRTLIVRAIGRWRIRFSGSGIRWSCRWIRFRWGARGSAGSGHRIRGCWIRGCRTGCWSGARWRTRRRSAGCGGAGLGGGCVRLIRSGGGGIRGTRRGRSLRGCRPRLWEGEAYVTKTEIAEADDEGQRYQSEKNKPGMGFRFVLVVEQIVKTLIGSIRRRAEVEDSTRVGRSSTRRLVAWSALGDRRGDLGGGVGERLATHSAEAVVAGIFIATMGAAHDYVFPWSKPTRSSDPRSRSS